MYEFRSSGLKDLISDPLTYYYDLEDHDYQSLAMIDGTERELLSYDIFTSFKCDLNKNYKQQEKGEVQGKNWICTGHPDIIGDDYICDIKNSSQTDKALIDTYTLQVSMYCAMFGKAKGYLFVDTNKGNDTDEKKCRLIEIPIVDKETLFKYLDNVADTLDKYKAETKPLTVDNPLIDEYAKNEAEIKRLEERQDEIKEVLETLASQNWWIKTNDYEVRTYLRREYARKIKVLSNTWTGNYTSYIKVVKNKGEKK